MGGSADGGLRTRIRTSPDYPRWVLITCVLGMFSTTFTATILTVSIKVVADDLGSTPATVAWVIVAPGLAGAVAMPILGRLGDIRGHRRVYLIGFCFALLFSVLTALAWSAASLITFRTLGQLAGTATAPASMAMLFKAYPPDQRLKVAGWTSGVMSVAAVSGLVIGGPMVDAFGWRPLFLIQAGLAAIGLVFAFVVLRPEGADHSLRLDRLGAVVLGFTAFALTFGVNRLPAWGVGHPVVLGAAVVFVVGLVTLPRVERHQINPVIPLELLRERNVRYPWAASFCTGACFIGTFVVTPLLLQDIFGMSVTRTSAVTLCRTVAVTFGSFLAGSVAVRLGSRSTATVAALAMTVGSLVLAVGAYGESLPLVIVGLMVSGVGSGSVQPATMAILGNSVDARHLGLAASMQQTMMSIGSVVATSLFSAIVTGSGEQRFAFAYTLAAIGAAGCVLATTRIDASAVGVTIGRRAEARAARAEERAGSEPSPV